MRVFQPDPSGGSGRSRGVLPEVLDHIHRAFIEGDADFAPRSKGLKRGSVSGLDHVNGHARTRLSLRGG